MYSSNYNMQLGAVIYSVCTVWDIGSVTVATLTQERGKVAFTQTYVFYKMLSLSGGSSSLLLFQFSKMTLMAQTLSPACLSWDPRFSPHPSKLHVVGCAWTAANSGPRGWSLSTCCRQELSHLLWSSPAFCNRLTYAQITCKLYLGLFPAWVL